MAVRLFIGNLPYGASEADLRAHFAAVAEPSHIVMPVDRETGRPRGFAFVEFAERAVAEEVQTQQPRITVTYSDAEIRALLEALSEPSAAGQPPGTSL